VKEPSPGLRVTLPFAHAARHWNGARPPLRTSLPPKPPAPQQSKITKTSELLALMFLSKCDHAKSFCSHWGAPCLVCLSLVSSYHNVETDKRTPLTSLYQGHLRGSRGQRSRRPTGYSCCQSASSNMPGIRLARGELSPGCSVADAPPQSIPVRENIF
jgi:hypothetical protein